MPHPHRPTGLCRFCSGAQALARRIPIRPRGSRRGDFPQQPAVAGTDYRQLPSTSWHDGTPERALHGCGAPSKGKWT